MNHYILTGDITYACVIRVSAEDLDEAIEIAESGAEPFHDNRCQVVELVPKLYTQFEWDQDEDNIQELPDYDWSS